MCEICGRNKGGSHHNYEPMIRGMVEQSWLFREQCIIHVVNSPATYLNFQ